MIKIIEIHHTADNKDNFQSRIIETESFDRYENELLKNGYGKFPYLSIPRCVKIENFQSGKGWLECEFSRPIDGARIKHIAWELQLDKTNFANYLDFENGSRIEIMNSDNSVRGFSREYICNFIGEREMNEFKSDAKEKLIEFVKYYKHNPFRYIKLFEGSFGIKLKWYQKILLFIPTKEQRRQKRIDKVLKKYLNVK